MKHSQVNHRSARPTVAVLRTVLLRMDFNDQRYLEEQAPTYELILARLRCGHLERHQSVHFFHFSSDHAINW